jgi:hypothetical protein
MFEEEQELKVFMVTFRDVMKKLEGLKDIDTANLQEAIEECFDGYNYDGEEELTGQENWCDYSADGEYKLNIQIDHEDAYEFTIHIKTKDGKVSVVNVL